MTDKELEFYVQELIKNKRIIQEKEQAWKDNYDASGFLKKVENPYYKKQYRII
jgi:hypothetical protein